MSDDLNCVHGPITLTIAFLAVDAAADTLQVTITLSCLATDERLEWSVREEWVAHRSLAAFERQLAAADDALLASTRGTPLLRISENAAGGRLDVGRPDAVFGRIATPPGLKHAFERAFLAYPRWW